MSKGEESHSAEAKQLIECFVKELEEIPALVNAVSFPYNNPCMDGMRHLAQYVSFWSVVLAVTSLDYSSAVIVWREKSEQKSCPSCNNNRPDASGKCMEVFLCLKE